ncbi:MAG: DedA family protein [Candidatus Binataceae bacterium]
MHSTLGPSGLTHWLSGWGYPGIFLCLFIGNVGIPIPEKLVLLAAGVLAGQKELDPGILYAVAILSVVSGDSCGFFLGRTGGQDLFEWLASRSNFLHRRYQRLQKFFQAHGDSAVFWSRFVMGARFMAGPMAGAAGMPYRKFLGWNLLGACISCFLFITIGYVVGNHLGWVVRELKEGGYWMAIAALMASAVAVLLIWWRKRHRRQ